MPADRGDLFELVQAMARESGRKEGLQHGTGLNCHPQVFQWLRVEVMYGQVAGVNGPGWQIPIRQDQRLLRGHWYLVCFEGVIAQGRIRETD